MKILGLRFSNLNSLYGEWSIDFTAPEFISNGIFSITGPTGSGKTTILDAICLALYGRTPRLKSISKTSNEIMSRQTADCFAEVIFETPKGRFRCHWHQHRAHKNRNGNLIESKHEISELATGKIIESKKRDVAKTIIEITGLDFYRFTRSILLAQGDFSTFLRASPDERSPILEQITGTEIYSKISIQVFDHKRNEQNKLELLQAETEGIVILTDEAEALENQYLEEKEKTEAQIAIRHKNITESIHCLEGIAVLKKEIVKLTQEKHELSDVLDTFKSKRASLHKALKAAQLESYFALLSSCRQQQISDKKSLELNKNLLKKAKIELTVREELLKNAENICSQEKQKQKQHSILCQKVSALDMLNLEKKKAILTEETKYKALEKNIFECKLNYEQASTNIAVLKKELELLEKYLTSNSCDEKLVTNLAGFTEQINNIHVYSDETRQISESLEKLITQFDNVSRLYEIAAEEHSTNDKLQKDAKKRLLRKKTEFDNLLGDRLLREYKTEYKTLLQNMLFLKKILDLANERGKLKNNSPCPLCGATDHPFKTDGLPEISKTEHRYNELTILIDKSEILKTELENLEEIEKRTILRLIESKQKMANAQKEKEYIGKYIEKTRFDIKKRNIQLELLKKAVFTEIEPLVSPGDTELNAILYSLKDRLEKWQEHQKKKSAVEKECSTLNANIQQISALLNSYQDSLNEEAKTLGEYRSQYEKSVMKRQNLYGDKVIADENLRIEKAVTNTEAIANAARTAKNTALNNVNEKITQIETLQNNISKRSDELLILENDFAARLKEASFPHEADFCSSQMTVAQRDRLSNDAKQLDETYSKTITRLADREQQLKNEEEKKITTKTIADLEIESKEVELLLKQTREETGALKQKLHENQKLKARLKEKQTLIEAQKKECRKWNNLNILIGSSDGKKYRNFAQGLTFELMVIQANIELEKMTDRYLLIHDEKRPLELNVVDNYQAGEIRSTQNLSGGESFIVSLSLALGLSKMASRRVRVDSLFLDEGFGTLDEEALETALETLAGLQHEGKLIGVISHVSALKERIRTQISVQALSGGKSKISGPGCRSISR